MTLPIVNEPARSRPSGSNPADEVFIGTSEMSALMRAKDWSQTPFGPVETWSPALRMITRFLLPNGFPKLLWWGPDYLSIYNDAYAPILGQKHPWALGRPVSEVWSEIHDILKPLIDTPFDGGPATWMEDIALDINRHGFVEETHFTVAYSPVPDDTAPGGIGGVLATVHEITGKVVGERRVLALRDIGLHTAESRTAEDACAVAAVALAKHPKDVPFALLYLVDADGRAARLAGATGVAMGETMSPRSIDLLKEIAGNGWDMAEAIRSEAMVVVDDLPRRFGALPLVSGVVPPHRAVVVPIRSAKPHQFAGLMVAGVGAHLKLDELYRSFYELAASQIATAIANGRAYEEERLRAEALAEIDRVKTAFFSNVSHEFRTPLTLMLGPLEDVLNDVTPDALTLPQRRQLDLVHRNSLRLMRLVNTLLDFSRLEAGRIQARFQPTDLAALTADLASGFRSTFERAGLFLMTDCHTLPVPVFVDRDMWEKVILNLLSNAFKFTFEGGITVTLRAKGGRAVLRVRDTGVGIPASEVARLFERFHRIEGQRSRSFESSGIGLALVHELVKQHSGEIQAVSEPGRGTEFTVSIALGTAHLPSDRIAPAAEIAPPTPARLDAFVEEALRWLPSTDPAPLRPPAANDVPRPHIVLADDNADMRDYVRHLLGPHYDITAVSDGVEALAASRTRAPDLVLTDVMMPRLDGFGLLQAIREDPALRNVPVVVLSARAGAEAEIEGLAAGADDYLVKPFSSRELIARVSSNLRLAEIRRKTINELAASERRFRAFVQASSDVVYRMSPDWSEMRELAGRDFIADTSGPNRGWLETYIHPDDRAHVTQAIERAIRTKSLFELEHRVRRVDGTLGWTFSRAVPILDARGEIVEWFGTASDVTARRTAAATG